MKIKNIKQWIGAFILACGLAACSDSEGGIDVPAAETCSLTIRLGAEGTVETRVGDDNNAHQGEFINTLWVFVVNADTKAIDAKFTIADGETESVPEAAENSGGNVLRWWHTVEDIPTGNKIIYAFANMDAVSETGSNTNMKTLLDGYDVGETISVDNLVISDPAGNVNIAEGQYIPMSVEHREQVTGNNTITVELVRLVARVDVTIKNTKKDGMITLENLTIGNFTDNVHLFPDNASSEESSSLSEEKEIDLSGTSIASGGSSEVISFYVNETINDNYNITLTTTENSIEETYTGALALQDEDVTGIPRNHFLPLNLTVGDNKLIIEMFLAPIGVYPFEAGVSGDLLNPAASNTVKIPEGCSFRVRDAADEKTYYEITTESDIIQIDNDDKTWAHVTALPGQQATITANRMDIYLETVAIKDIGESYQTQAFSWRSTDCPVQMVLSRPAMQ